MLKVLPRTDTRVVKLSDIADLNPRLREKPAPDTKVSFVPMAAVSGETGTVVSEEIRQYGEVAKGYTAFENGDVLVAKITPCFENNKIAQATLSLPTGFGSTEFHVVRAHRGEADPRYLLHFLRQDHVRSDGERKMTGSAGQRRVPEHFLASLDILLPPLAEQRHIAAILDQADALRAKRREALVKLDEMAQAIFVEMFGDRDTNPKGWPISNLADVAEFYSGSTLPGGEPFSGQEGGTLLVKVSDMNLPGNETEIRSSALWTTAPARASIVCPVDAVLIPKRGGAIGTNKKRLTIRKSVLDPNMMGIKGKENSINVSYLFHWFMQLDLNTLTNGSSVPQLNKKDLNPLQIAVPPLSIQREFGERIRCVRALITEHSRCALGIDFLFSSLQHRAFSGDL